MKALFTVVFSIIAVSQVAAADQSCFRVNNGHDVFGNNRYTVACDDSVPTDTKCDMVISGHDVYGNNSYVVSCSDNGGATYDVSEDTLSLSEAEALLGKLEARIYYRK